MTRISSRRAHLAPALALVALLVAPAAGRSATTLGAGAPITGGTPIACAAGSGHVQGIGDPNLGYVVNGQGVITKWSFQAGTGGGSLALQVLSWGTLDTYTALAESAVESPAPSALNTFDTRLAVEGDEYLGLRVATGNPDCLYGGFPGLYNASHEAPTAPAVGGGPVFYGTQHDGARLNLEAVIESDDDRDGFGDETQDGCPDDAARQDDCVKPEIQLDRTKLKGRKATMFFSSNEPNSTFECHMKHKKYKPCESPLKLKRLKVGLHTFTVRTIDANDNVSTATSFWWKAKKKRR
jgi:hypothetical protein